MLTFLINCNFLAAKKEKRWCRASSRRRTWCQEQTRSWASRVHCHWQFWSVHNSSNFGKFRPSRSVL